jgi:hypothetical protein
MNLEMFKKTLAKRFPNVVFDIVEYESMERYKYEGDKFVLDFPVIYVGVKLPNNNLDEYNELCDFFTKFVPFEFVFTLK